MSDDRSGTGGAVAGRSTPRRGSTGNRWTMIALVALFAVPWLLALVWEPTGYVNHGELVVPPRPLEDVSLRALDGTAVTTDSLRGQWSMVVFLRRDCPRDCQTTLYNMRQVRLAQGRRSGRIRLVAVVEPDSTELGAEVATKYPAFAVVTGEPSAVAGFARQFELGQEASPAASGRVFLVDPIGNLMMSYTPGSDPSGMRKDLVRLLKVSQVG